MFFEVTQRALVAAGLIASAAAASAQAPAAAPQSPSPAAVQALYQQHCAACHGAQRLGGMGPALLPESLARLRKPEALKVIQDGRAATQMLPFKATLKPEEIAALTDWIYTPVTPAPTWTDADIAASRVETAGWKDWPAQPQWKADPMNLFVVVEGGDHHVSLVDGDTFEPIYRFASRFALHGGPKVYPINLGAVLPRRSA